MDKYHQLLSQCRRITSAGGKKIKKTENTDGETVFGLSPTATGTFNKMLHPVIVLLILTVLCFTLIIILYVKLWIMVKHLFNICPQLFSQ